MSRINELLSNCDDEKPRIREAYIKIKAKNEKNGLPKPDLETFLMTYYIGQAITWINDDLRNGLKLSKCKELFTEHFDKALEKIESYTGIVYRMDTPNADTEYELDWFKTNIGKTICVPVYLSTSTERWDNRPVTWQIETLKTGSYGKDITELNKEEMEILFKRDSKFEIISVIHNSATVILQEVGFKNKVDISLVRDYTGFQKNKNL